MTHHTEQERIGGYEDCHLVNQITTPLNGGTCSGGGPRPAVLRRDFTGAGEQNSCERGNTDILQQAIIFLDKQRNRALYPMDEQIKTQKEINEFIKRWQCTKNTH